MIESNLITLDKIVEKSYAFNIPRYQRLYVWKKPQIETLLEDIYSSLLSGDEIFYLGGVLVVKNHEKNKIKTYDLIDGQQRFTTLWMLSIVFGQALDPFVQIKTKEGATHRVRFAIREDVFIFFEDYINKAGNNDVSANIQDAFSVIESFKNRILKEQKITISEYTNFVKNNLSLVFIEVPKKTDLNKLFEVTNNRGVQLQHHEILKAKILRLVPVEVQMAYSHLWDACSHMEDYVEKNLKNHTNVRVQNFFENEYSEDDQEKLLEPSVIINAIKDDSSTEIDPITLQEIFASSPEDKTENESSASEDDFLSDKVRSIITFPMLLQHTLRIYLSEYYGNQYDLDKILDRELLKIFDEQLFKKKPSSEEITSFLDLLWKIRYYFDKYVIKWVQVEKGEEHFINKLEKFQSRKNFYLRRRMPTKNEGLDLLQSMLYHSQQITTHYWLTPFLSYLYKNGGKNVFDYLKKMDNYLLLSTDEDSLIRRTKKLLENPGYKPSLDISILEKPLGTVFPHYLFYKLEFILWHTLKDEKDERWKNFKITAKNSVEHISPQHKRKTDRNIVSEKMLHKFGNLALVSRSINSEYGDLPFNEKRQRFLNNNHKSLDSLKMDLIYSNKDWNDDLALTHQEQMINYFKNYIYSHS